MYPKIHEHTFWCVEPNRLRFLLSDLFQHKKPPFPRTYSFALNIFTRRGSEHSALLTMKGQNVSGVVSRAQKLE